MVAVAADWEVSRSRWPHTCLAGGRGPGARARAGGVGNADCAGRPVACAGWRGCGQPRSEPVAPRGRPRIARVRRPRAAARLPGRTGRGYPPGPAPAATEYRKTRPSPRGAGVGRPRARESRRAWPACPGGPACAPALRRGRGVGRALTWVLPRPSGLVPRSPGVRGSRLPRTPTGVRVAGKGAGVPPQPHRVRGRAANRSAPWSDEGRTALADRPRTGEDRGGTPTRTARSM